MIYVELGEMFQILRSGMEDSFTYLLYQEAATSKKTGRCPKPLGYSDSTSQFVVISGKCLTDQTV